MSYNTSTDVWYQYFKSDDGPQAVILIAFYGGRALFATLGVLFNASIVYVTVKSKSLHGVCNIMIAMDSAFSMILDASFYNSFFVQLSGLRFLRYDQCFWFLLPFGMFGEMAQLTMVFTGIDRLLAVLFPFWYNKRSKKFHFLILGTLLTLFAIYNSIINYFDFNQSRDVMVACATNEMGQTALFGSIMHVNGLTLSGSLMIIYSTLWFIVFQLKTTNINVNENNRKVIKSLIFIILLNMFGVFCRITVNMFFKLLSPNVFIKRGFSNVASLLVITVYSANAPVLYTISNEYRDNFNRHFKWLPKVISIGPNQVEIQNVMTSNTTGPMPLVQIISIPNRRGSYVFSS